MCKHEGERSDQIGFLLLKDKWPHPDITCAMSSLVYTEGTKTLIADMSNITTIEILPNQLAN